MKGKNKKQIWEFMKEFGPFLKPNIKKLWIFPIYDNRHPEYADNIKKIRDYLISNCPYYRNPGLEHWFKGILFPSENAIPIDMKNIEGWLNGFINDQRIVDADFPDHYQENSQYQALYLIQLPIDEEYWNLKDIFCQRGILNQIISKIDSNQRAFGFQRWNILNSIIPKIKGIPWTIDTTNKGRNGDLSLALGFRFKRKGSEFLSAIATVLSGAGNFIGYFAENFQINKLLSRGMKLSAEQIDTILTNLTTDFLHNLKDKSILITRLGIFPKEERAFFIKKLEKLNIQRYALVSIVSDLIKISTMNEDFLPLGTFFEHNSNQGTLIPIGNIFTNKGEIKNQLFSISTSLEINLEYNKNFYQQNGQESEITGVARDIMNLCWLNWQSIFFPVAGYPVTLSYAEKITKFLVKGIQATGDLKRTTWFL
jgi:hypothetical protein